MRRVGRVRRGRNIPVDSQEYDYSNDEKVRVSADDEVGDLVEDMIVEVLAAARQDLSLRNDSRVGLTIHTTDQTGREVAIGIPFKSFRELDAQSIIDVIISTLNSYQELDLGMRFVVSSIRENNFEGVRGRAKAVSSHTNTWLFSSNKKSIVQINPIGDHENEGENCVAQWIVLGLSFLIRGGYIPSINELGLDDMSYNRMIRGNSRFKFRKQYAATLMDNYNVMNLSLSVLKDMEQRFGVRFVLFSLFHSLRLEYPFQHSIPFNDLRPAICGLLHGSDLEEWKHIDFICKPSALHSDKGGRSYRFCYRCFEVYPRKQSCDVNECKDDISPCCGYCHCCLKNCTTCQSQECGRIIRGEEEECVPFENLVRCEYCNSIFFSPKCEELHMLHCTVLFCKRCEECGNKEHKGLKCGQMRCFMCSDAFDITARKEHQCFLKRTKMKPENNKIVVYDFECALDEDNIHVPYLCTAWLPYGHDQIEAFKRSYPWKQLPDGSPVFVFWGLGNTQEATGVYAFFNFVCDPLLKGHILFAHNARSYDSILVKNYMSKYKSEFSVDVQRGQKFLSMKFVDLEIEFRDSLSFIPTSLRDMSSNFGIAEIKKGHFPHKIVTVEYLQRAETLEYILPKPLRTDYEFDPIFGKKGERAVAELNEWLDNFYSDGLTTWNVRKEAEDYCISDTVLLGETLKIFRHQMMEMTDNIPRAEGVEFESFDVLTNITLASSMMSFYLSQMLPERTIGVIDRAESFERYDTELFFKWIEFHDGVHLVDINEWAKIDNTGKCHVYRDCYTHGCRICYSPIQRNERMNLSFGVCFHMGEAEVEKLRSHYGIVNVISVWGHEFEEEKRQQDFKEWFRVNRIEDQLPLDPRQAYKGGKVEVYKMAHPDRIQMCDFVSMYPTTLMGNSYDPLDLEGESMLEWPMPIGQPVRYWRPMAYNFDNGLQGIAKVRVLCPRNLYAPFLSHRVPSLLNPSSYQVLYGICRSCMEFRVRRCTHEEVEERAFTGTWTLAEIRHAMSLGYEIINVVEVWEYPYHDASLFRSFIVPFMVEKIISKKDGLVHNNEFTDKGRLIQQYLYELTGEEFTPDKFSDSPARRTVAKLAQNSFTGKWGEQEVHKSSRTFMDKDHKEARRILFDPAVEVLQVTVVDEEGMIVVIQYQSKKKCSRTPRRKNDIIVSHITAFGRIMLSRLEQALGRDLIYNDTDSAFNTKKETCVYKSGFRTGDLEQELEDGYGWVSGGAKWYAYLLPDGRPVCKLKGFSLKASNGVKVTPSLLWKHLVRCKYYLDQQTGNMNARMYNHHLYGSPHIEMSQVLFKTESENCIVPFKRTIRMAKSARIQLLSSKRMIMFPDVLDEDTPCMIDTLPYGYVGEH